MRQYFHNRFFMSVLLLSLCANGAMWLWLSTVLTPSVEHVPLHYNITFGIDFVGPWWFRFGFPAAGFVAVVVNTVFSVIFFQRNRLLSAVTALASPALHILLFVSAYLSVMNV